MLYVTLNDGRTETLMHISQIEQIGKDVIYYSAKGSLNGYKEHFDTEQEAHNRYEELQASLIV